MFALQVTQLIDSSLHDPITILKRVDDATSPSRPKRILGWIKNLIFPTCEHPITSPHCKGLCGKGCTCWKWVAAGIKDAIGMMIAVKKGFFQVLLSYRLFL